MRIEAVDLVHVQIPLRRAFEHATSRRSVSEAVLVGLTDDTGERGWGEIRPRAYVTGETIDTALDRDAPALAAALLADAFSDREAVLAWSAARLTEGDAGRVGNPVALAAIGGFADALLDLAGRRMGFALADAIGGTPGPALPAGVVIGFEITTEALPRHCAMLRLHGRRHVKIKIGADDDATRVAIAANVFGPDVPLRLDANGIWSPDTAIDRIGALMRLGGAVRLCSIEQPVAKDDLAGMRRVREATGLPVMADESVCSFGDVERLLFERAADIVNVRIGKHGGVIAAHRIATFAHQAGLGVHLGTLVGETGILSRQAEVLSRFVPSATCLDGKGQNVFLLAEDVLQVPDNKKKVDVAEVSLRAPGLGVQIDDERVRRFAVNNRYRHLTR